MAVKQMRIIALRTYSLSCDPIIEPLRRLGHEVREITFFQPHHPFDYNTIPGAVGEADFAFMLGQNDDGGGHVPPVEILAAASERTPFVHICCDGSEVIWWPQLETYRALAPKMFHVNIDGVEDGFFSHAGMTTLCPLDPVPWDDYRVAWRDRDIPLGFCGGWGVKHPRGDKVEELLAAGVPLHATKRPFGDYNGFRGFMGRCRGVWNHAHSGSADHMQVKARVLETAFAGAVLVEPTGSPTALYFEKGKDFLTWESNEDVANIAGALANGDSYHAGMAARFREKATDLYSAAQFWPKVFHMAGL